MINIQNKNYSSLITGACVVESFEICDQMIRLLTDKGINLVQAGIFKPTTKTDDFQRLGLDGIEMINDVKKDTIFQLY